jgi:hypothetical protein
MRLIRNMLQSRTREVYLLVIQHGRQRISESGGRTRVHAQVERRLDQFEFHNAKVIVDMAHEIEGYAARISSRL